MLSVPAPIMTLNAIALPDAGGLVNDTVVAPLGVKLNVVPVERSRVWVYDTVEYWCKASAISPPAISFVPSPLN